jgi:hypothetical protein
LTLIGAACRPALLDVAFLVEDAEVTAQLTNPLGVAALGQLFDPSCWSCCSGRPWGRPPCCCGSGGHAASNASSSSGSPTRPCCSASSKEASRWHGWRGWCLIPRWLGRRLSTPSPSSSPLWPSLSRSCAIGCMRLTGSSTAPWYMSWSPCCSGPSTQQVCLAWAGSSTGYRAGHPARGRLHPGRGGPVPAGPPPHPSRRGSALQPPPLRRRQDCRGI